MHVRNVVNQALREVWRARQRTTLMALALGFGVAGAIVAQSYASSGHAQLVVQLRRLGLSVVTVTPKQSRNTGVRARTGAPVTTLDARDYTEIRRGVLGIDRASATVYGSFLAKSGDLSKSNCSVVGVEPAFALIRQWQLREGTSFGDSDQRAAARVAVLGASVARDLFNGASPVGQRVFINRVPFRVLGVLADSGSDLEAGSQDEQIYVPLRTASRRLLNVDSFSSLALNVSEGTPIATIVAGVRQVLTHTHRTASATREDFQIQTQEALAAAASDAEARVRRYVSLVTAGALLTAGFGALAVCWIGVGQRTAEIGTRRALGASACNIFLQFLTEVLLIGVGASLIGLIAGWAASAGLSRAFHLPLDFYWYLGASVAASEVILVLAFGAGPAIRASRIDPIRALQTG
jgi:putative ABC transport system permease protein